MGVVGLLALLFIAVPVAEIYVIMEVGSALGGLNTVALILLMAIAGASLARSQGSAALRQIQESMSTGRAIGGSLADGALVLVAAVLMITPGFITDGVGLLLLVPQVRRLLSRRVARWAQARAAVVQYPRPGGDDPPPGVIDV